MDTLSSAVSIRELRAQLADVLGRAGYGGQRIGITRNGKLAAVVISVEDLEALEAFELAQDTAAYRTAKANDDGTRVSLEQLRAEIDAEEAADDAAGGGDRAPDALRGGHAS
ncbi:type II toxin-antitoxin system Phd/YefM family antitoxin [Quadrisphaera granulorum]|uniref:type II toxin-antitoxin system Phd/YefM family antitoxin n=1 Tax=Quadrisphaera granulorum TaxID=317664 RepID=UPI000D6D0E26|nr:type II toxin-antitoxin system Phd/YefM family antitoxin [Quadrisphaera granulorum]